MRRGQRRGHGAIAAAGSCAIACVRPCATIEGAAGTETPDTDGCARTLAWVSVWARAMQFRSAKTCRFRPRRCPRRPRRQFQGTPHTTPHVRPSLDRAARGSHQRQLSRSEHCFARGIREGCTLRTSRGGDNGLQERLVSRWGCLRLHSIAGDSPPALRPALCSALLPAACEAKTRMSSQDDDATPRGDHPASEGGDGGVDGEGDAKRSRKRTKLGVYTSGEAPPATGGAEGAGGLASAHGRPRGSCQWCGGTARRGNLAIRWLRVRPPSLRPRQTSPWRTWRATSTNQPPKPARSWAWG